MVKIMVTKREIDLLEMCYKNLNLNPNYLVDKHSIVIKDDEKNNLYIMFNCILDVFLKIGLLGNDEPNEIGKELENLNNKVNHEYVIINSEKGKIT